MEFLRTYLIIILSFIAAIFVIPTVILSLHNVNLKNELTSYKDTTSMYEENIFKLTTDVVQYNIEVENYKDTVSNLRCQIDTINMELDSINEELILAKIKLERIKEYNRIAAQGNNIKFLRGWINRVFNN